ncbi:MAG TPA: VCBS repeat-containing protein [Actinomycetota bacterium]|nr:VCBS repeat-containing protein [Actinomycetota bacterium]
MRAAAVASGVLAALAPAAVAVDFAPRSVVPGGNLPIAVALGDLDRNGTTDMAVANYNTSSVSVRLGTRTGQFGAAKEFGTLTNPHAVAIGDLDSDGAPDLAVANFSAASVTVRSGNGTGGFGPAKHIDVGGSPSTLELADLNGDGKRDLTVANFHHGTVTRRLGTGLGGFGPPRSFTVGTYPNSIATGDFNGDANVDLAVANFYEQHGVSVLLGTGTGDFAPAAGFPAGRQAFAVAVAHFDDDADPDLVVTNNSASQVSVLLGRDGGTFGPPATFQAGAAPTGVIAEDFDGDALSDLAVANYDSGDVSVLLGRGGGKFSAAVAFPAGTAPVALAHGDLDGDGLADLAVANAGSRDIAVLLNRTKRVPAGLFEPAVNFPAGDGPDWVATGDFNADTFVDVAVPNRPVDQLSVLLGTGSGGLGVGATYPTGDSPNMIVGGDFNRDGTPDLATSNRGGDVSVLLAAGGGAFGPTTSYKTHVAPTGVVVGDFNRDANPDLASTNYNSGSSDVSVLLGQGDGAFGSPIDSSSGSYPAGLAVGDFNEDLNPDLVVVNQNLGPGVAVLLGTGTGDFADPIRLDAEDVGPASVAVGDFNGDTHLDFVMGSILSESVWVWLGDGRGGFAGPSSYLAGANGYSIVVSDFNADGDPDLAVAGQSPHVSVLLGEGDGRFGPFVHLDTGKASVGVASSDFNRDGRPDLAVANAGSDDVSILLAAATPPKPTPPRPTEPQPVARKSVIVVPLNQKVRVKCAGKSRPLLVRERVNLGCRVERGQVMIIAAADTNGATQTATFYGGAFTVGQVLENAGKVRVLVTTLKLGAPTPRACKAPGGHLWGKGAGRWRTIGLHGSAISAGPAVAWWLTQERCTGTFFRVAEGRATVRNRRGGTRILKKSGVYLAPK